MADLFLKEDVLKLLEGKFILMIGDSNIKSFYKDLLHLYAKNDIAPSDFFRIMPNQTRTESCLGDQVLRVPKYITPGRDNYEEREFKDDFVHIRFHFVTKAYGKTMQSTLRSIEEGIIPMPNVIVMNSCVWDLTRWGPKQEDNYKKDLISLFGKIKKIVSKDTLTIWCSTLPIAVQQCKGGIIIKQLEFMKYSLRFMVLEANKFTQQLCVAFGIDFLDLHYHMRFQLHRRAIDGIHWETHAIRMIVCLILTHIGLSFEIPLPCYMSERGIDYVRDAYDKAAEVNFPTPLDAIGFHKDIQDKIERELEKCTKDENLKKRDTQERVFKFARRQGNVTEDNGSNCRHQNSRSGKFKPILWPQENNFPPHVDSRKKKSGAGSSDFSSKFKRKSIINPGKQAYSSLINGNRAKSSSYLEFERNYANDRNLNERNSFSTGACSNPVNNIWDTSLSNPNHFNLNPFATQNFPNFNLPNLSFADLLSLDFSNSPFVNNCPPRFNGENMAFSNGNHVPNSNPYRRQNW